LTAPSSIPAHGGATATRKADHIRINLEEDVSSKGVGSGFESYQFQHVALPEMSLSEVDISTTLFGRRLSAPILISCMTGGVPEAAAINATLARAAQANRFALGLGSARVLLERPNVLPSFDVRKYAPDVPLLANLGAVQLNKGVGIEECRRLVDLLQADALVLHLNPLQEALQPEGDTDFSDLLIKIEDLCRRIEVPVVAKEIGWGVAPDLVGKLLAAGVAAVDVAGAGGTSWSEVERHRMSSPVRRRIAAAFAGWGIPTSECLVAARRVAPEAIIFASGGIRGGVDVAKALALGADLVGLAGPFLRAADGGETELAELADELTEVLRIAMFAVGTRNVAELRGTPRLMSSHAVGSAVCLERLRYVTTRSLDFVDITDDVVGVVRGSGVTEGLVHISSHHTTAAIRINENEPLLLEDFREFLGRLVPSGDYQHNDLGRRLNIPPDEPQNGHAHIQHLLLSSSDSVPISRGQMQLGAWQRIFLIELDSARERQVTVQVLGK
jgi:isopentenyl-diphosphate delta-isomerase